MPRLSEATRAARREQILEAATACFARRGFTQTSMAEIIQASGLSAGSIYSHFSSKEEILYAAAAENFSRTESALARTAALYQGVLTPRQAALTLAEHLTDNWQKGRMFLQFEAEALNNGALASQVQQNMDRATRIVAEGLRPWARLTLAASPTPEEHDAAGPPGEREEAARWARMTMAVVHGYLIRVAVYSTIQPKGLLGDLTALLPDEVPAPEAASDATPGLASEAGSGPAPSNRD